MVDDLKTEKIKTGNKSPIFILGCVRSGTTLMRSILAAHPDIEIPRETIFFNFVEDFKKKSKNDIVTEKGFQNFWNQYTSNRRFLYLDLNKDSILQQIQLKGHYSFKNIFDSVMEAAANKAGKIRWGDKSPGHEFYLEEILSYYPNAKVIFMLRDPRGVSASLKNVKWNNIFFSAHIKRWKRSIEAFEKYKNDERVKLVEFNSLVKDPEVVVKEVCLFINEEFHASMLTNRKGSIGNHGDESWTSQYEKSVVEKEIDDKSLNKWQHELTCFEIKMIERLTQPEFSKYGYTKSPDCVFKNIYLLKYYGLMFIYSIKQRLINLSMRNQNE